MRARAFLWLGVLILPLVLGGVLTTPAAAGEEEGAKREREHAERARHAEKRGADERRHKAILRGLAQGIEALRALGKREEAAHLERIYNELKSRHGQQQKKHARKSERQVVEGWIELMGYAVKVLVEAGHEERAELLEHGKHAFELALAGKKDERSMKIRRSAPPRARMAECLLHTAELLQDQGDEHHAKLMAELGRSWQKKRAKRRAGERREAERREHEGAGLESLAHRVEIMKLALPALRESERKEAIEILERGIRTGEVMLAEREDEEAREIVEQTPPLGHLAEVLHLASDLWKKFGNEKKAQLVAGLAHHYTEKVRAARREEAEHDGEDEAREREGRRHRQQDERAEELQRLHREMVEMREALEHLQRRLRELMRER